MSTSVRALFDTQKTLAFGSVVAGYTAVGTAFANPVRILMVSNTTDADLQFSIDGATDHFMLAAFSAAVFDISGNRSATTNELLFAAGLTVYVKRIGVPSEGAVYISSIYGRND